jgi:DNA polymerase-3 subunit gamma/tau
VLSLADVRRIWPDLLEQVKKMRRFTWILLSQNAQVIGVDATSLTVGFKTAGARDSFVGGGSEEILRQAAIEMIGADWKIEVAVDPSADPGSETSPRVIRPAVASTTASAATATPSPDGTGASPVGLPDRPPSWATDEADAGATSPGQTAVVHRQSAATARSNITATRGAADPVPQRVGPDLDADADRDDPAAEDNALDSTQLLERELGATVIEEIPHD